MTQRKKPKEETMTAFTNPTSPAMPILATQPMLEFNAPPTLENLTVISKLGQVAARVRFTVHTRSIEKYKPSPRHRRESTRTVEGELELTVRVVGRAQAPIVMTARHVNNVLERSRPPGAFWDQEDLPKV